MSTIATTVRISDRLQERYDKLAKATGRTRNYLMTEALERYVAREEWQFTQTQATLAKLEAGKLPLIPAEELMDRYLAEGRVTREGLDEADRRYDAHP
ncbi:MAG TPA: ribbon-helix-helix protein, CopG family [Chloroflexota bacterium]|nr:ribbon-helix-helix protein, CopG family [Chloroflexota bacterium]